MKRILIITLILIGIEVDLSLACNSNCMMCHMKIPKDINHEQIQQCINCHQNHKLDVVNQCGADCFDCHSYKKVMSITKEHKVIENCSNCHINLKGKTTEGLPFFLENKPEFKSPFKLK